MSGFGLARPKIEGAPAHPEDIYLHCGCAKCEARWTKQLKDYNDYMCANGMAEFSDEEKR